jgi:hypothetical protein
MSTMPNIFFQLIICVLLNIIIKAIMDRFWELIESIKSEKDSPFAGIERHIFYCPRKFPDELDYNGHLLPF